jgi:ABC-2 type transport system permease protein
MPEWLRQIAHLNPLTYEVDGLRALMLAGGDSSLGLGLDFVVLITALTLLVLIGGWSYPRIVT